jgi:hypothetical protein
MRRFVIAASIFIALGLFLIIPNWVTDSVLVLGTSPFDAWEMTRELTTTGRFGVVLGSTQVVGAVLLVLGLLVLAYLAGRRSPVDHARR